MQEGMQREAEEAAKRAAQRRKQAGYASNSPEPTHYQPYSQYQLASGEGRGQQDLGTTPLARMASSGCA
jgi:hypothetical protein